MQAGQQAADGGGPLDLGGQRGRGDLERAGVGGDQGDAPVAELGQGADELFGGVDQDALDELAERAFDSVFPAVLDAEAFADAGAGIQPVLLEPSDGGALLLAEGGLLQGFERGQAAARGLGLLADVGQFGLAGALAVLQAGDGFLAGFDLFGQAIKRGLLGFVLQLQFFEGFGQCVEVESDPFGAERFTAAVGFEHLAVEVVDAGAFDFAGARSFGGGAGMGFPARLPVGQLGFGVAQGFLLDLVFFLQLFELGLGEVDSVAQDRQLGFVAADVLAKFGQGLGGFVAGLVQALGHLALVLDLLFEPGQGAADLIDLGLGGAEGVGGFLAAHAAGFDTGFGVALFGDELLQAGFFLREGFAEAAEAGVEVAVLKGLPLGVLDPALFLQALVLFGLAGLALEVFELFADFLAQVVEAVEVLAGVADAGFGFLAAFLVLGDAGGFFEVDAQVFGAGFDDLADHALFDDGVAARAEAGTEEQVGDVAAAALGTVEVVVAAAVAADGTLDRDFVERGVLAGNSVVGIVEDQFDGRLRDGLARGGAGEDDVGQRVATQAAGRAFAHDPAHGIDDVGLATAIGPDHAGHVGGQMQGGGINKRLEAGELDRGQTHGVEGFRTVAMARV